VLNQGTRIEFLDIDANGFSDPDIPGTLTRTTDGYTYRDGRGTVHQHEHQAPW